MNAKPSDALYRKMLGKAKGNPLQGADEICHSSHRGNPFSDSTPTSNLYEVQHNSNAGINKYTPVRNYSQAFMKPQF